MEASCYWLYAYKQKYSFKKYTECVKREAITLICVFQLMKQNILHTLFDDIHKIISEI